MKSKCWLLLILCCLSYGVQANILIKQHDMNVKQALNAIARDMQLKLVDSAFDEKKDKQVITQDLSGDSMKLLNQLSSVYDFDWYVYGGKLTVQSNQDYINYIYKPVNISPDALLSELKLTFQTNSATKITLTERDNSILFSGSRGFINDIVDYAAMVDKNQFLENDNNLEVERITFNYISVADRSLKSYGSSVSFPGAKSIISNAIDKLGKFQNLNDTNVLEQAYKVKLDAEGDKQQLEDKEETSKVQILPGSNALLIRGTPQEIQLAKRIASLIDVKRHQLIFSLKVYDVSAERNDSFGLDDSWLKGSRSISEILEPSILKTVNFLRNFHALYSNGTVRGVYETNLLVLENQEAHFGKKQTVTIALTTEREAKVEKITADNSLYVTGHLLPSGGVQATVNYVEESLGGSDSAHPPQVNSQSLDTEIYIHPEQTIILGGFENTNTESTKSGVPVLSSIPLLGELFKYTSETKRKYKRYVSISYQVVE